MGLRGENKMEIGGKIYIDKTEHLHPLRCETCSNKKCYHYPLRWKESSQCWSKADHASIWKFTAEYGCASHSSRPAMEPQSDKYSDEVAAMIRKTRDASSGMKYLTDDEIMYRSLSATAAIFLASTNRNKSVVWVFDD